MFFHQTRTKKPSKYAKTSQARSLVLPKNIPVDHDPMPAAYACAIIFDPLRGLLLEARGATARHAAGHLTCFGGRQEEGESIEDCLRRELREEIGYTPEWIRFALTFHRYKDGILTHSADFFEVAAPIGTPVCLVPDHQALWVADWKNANLSPWHACALQDWKLGNTVSTFVSKQ